MQDTPQDQPDVAPTGPSTSAPSAATAVRVVRLGSTALVLAALLVACDLLSPAPANQAPSASFSVTPPSGPSPLTVQVDASASSDADGTVASYAWQVTGPTAATDFGKTAQFTFDDDGTYTVTLTVTDDDDATDATSREVRVGLANLPPTAAFTVTPSSGAAPLSVDVDAGSSSDTDGSIAAYAWSTDDGQSDSGVTATFTFDDPGTHAIILTVTDDDGATDQDSRIVTADFPGATPGFRIDLLFADPSAFSTVERDAFEDAATRWSEVISGDLSDDTVPAMAPDFCGGGENAVAEMPVDDLIIQVMLASIDGEFGVVAFAGPCRLRTSGTDAGLTKYGIMVFDSADASRMAGQNTLSATVLHEMGHVLGLGTRWQANDLLEWEPAGEPCETTTFTSLPHYSGAGAKAGYAAAGATGDVPVEEDGSAGTRCGHWDEGILDNEIMTGWIEASGTPMPLSQVTSGSLQDMGYSVSLAATDAYTVPACAPSCGNLRTQGVGERINEILIRPAPEDLR